MEKLKQKILQDGVVIDNKILKVDHFLNHQIDPGLTMEMGEAFYERFKDKPITKILTIEVSGIPVALATALYFKVPCLFAKKSSSLTLSEDTYKADVYSFTKQKTFSIQVDKTFLNAEDQVLIIDDFLAQGNALTGLIQLCHQAQAQIQGLGIVIEKSLQKGGQVLREQGYDLHSLIKIKNFEDNRVVFED